MTFDPTKRVAVKVSDVDRARFWYAVRLYAKVLGIVLLIGALALWALMSLLERVGY